MQMTTCGDRLAPSAKASGTDRSVPVVAIIALLCCFQTPGQLHFHFLLTLWLDFISFCRSVVFEILSVIRTGAVRCVARLDHLHTLILYNLFPKQYISLFVGGEDDIKMV